MNEPMNIKLKLVNVDEFILDGGIARIGAPAFCVYCAAVSQADPATGLLAMSASDIVRWTGQRIAAVEEAIGVLHDHALFKLI